MQGLRGQGMADERAEERAGHGTPAVRRRAGRWGLALAAFTLCVQAAVAQPVDGGPESRAPASAEVDRALTGTEMRWLRAAWPVLDFAREAALPVDVVVQPQDAPERPPMGLAWVNGRCKFVLSLRGNPEVAATVARMAPELFEATLQLMAAHEMGHCERHLRGEWKGGAQPAADLTPALAAQREEAYADLVGLAWTQRHHAAVYEQVHAWLTAERSMWRQRGAAHDTLAWARLATRAERFGKRSIFAEADALWREGSALAE